MQNCHSRTPLGRLKEGLAGLKRSERAPNWSGRAPNLPLSLVSHHTQYVSKIKMRIQVDTQDEDSRRGFKMRIQVEDSRRGFKLAPRMKFKVRIQDEDSR